MGYLLLLLLNVHSANANLLFQDETCEMLDYKNCINSIGCGWCDNITVIDDYLYINGSECKYVGFCGVDNNSTCFYKNENYICTSIRFAVICLFILFICTVSYTLILSSYRCLERSNMNMLFKNITIIFIALIIFAPIIISYYFNYIVFAVSIGIETFLAILFWACYGRKIIKTYNNPQYQLINDSQYDSI
tara:strand:+ start:3501 stop:4073 length:573 start_codon:yes stop_codon:yes gene_type:complete